MLVEVKHESILYVAIYTSIFGCLKILGRWPRTMFLNESPLKSGRGLFLRFQLPWILFGDSGSRHERLFPTFGRLLPTFGRLLPTLVSGHNPCFCMTSFESNGLFSIETSEIEGR